MITLRFVTCHDHVSDTIRRAEMGFWASHVEALMPDGTLLGAHYDGGVEARARDYDEGHWSKELYVRVPCDPAHVQGFEDFLKAQIGKPYDMAAIAEMAVGVLTGEAPDWPSKESWICSALQTAALLEAKILKAAPATVRLATPRDLLMALSSLVEIGQPVTPKGTPSRLFEWMPPPVKLEPVARPA